LAWLGLAWLGLASVDQSFDQSSDIIELELGSSGETISDPSENLFIDWLMFQPY
jgi:hypothetical protein